MDVFDDDIIVNRHFGSFYVRAGNIRTTAGIDIVFVCDASGDGAAAANDQF